jgi:hypothetical protein
MALTKEQVLSDAGELVTDLVTNLSGLDTTYEQEKEILDDAKRVFEASAQIINHMLLNVKKPTIQ